MNVHVRWDKGGEASVVEVSAGGVVLLSTAPSPPGSRLEGAFAAEPHERVRVKVHGSKKQADGVYVVSGRLIDATRGLRERLTRAAGDARSPAAAPHGDEQVRDGEHGEGSRARGPG